ncbi:unnamed protein product [Nippostrongylus brasiliensis]|uniref:Uncharacterized protein n=1 Tax=Nippostrongylus brasiliensis TaxID=27835 RepID=A0A0N4YLC8_NIPBR|nr:unnamed protein product [Nippostrongylus brasiliensis]
MLEEPSEEKPSVFIDFNGKRPRWSEERPGDRWNIRLFRDFFLARFHHAFTTRSDFCFSTHSAAIAPSAMSRVKLLLSFDVFSLSAVGSGCGQRRGYCPPRGGMRIAYLAADRRPRTGLELVTNEKQQPRTMQSPSFIS